MIKTFLKERVKPAEFYGTTFFENVQIRSKTRIYGVSHRKMNYLWSVELSANDKKILRRYFVNRPIRRAYVFGSYARKKAAVGSDLDILVELDHSEPIGMKFFGYRLELEELLKKKVDLVSVDGLSPHIKPFVDKDKVLIYEKGAD